MASLPATEGVTDSAIPSEVEYEIVGSDVGFSLGLLPLLITLPFIFFPKVIDTDIQPWMLSGALLSFLCYWPSRPTAQGSRFIVSLLAVCVIGAYWVRAPQFAYFIRYVAVISTFVMLWHIASRGTGSIVGTFVRFTILLWFAFGAIETVAFRLGVPITVFGRFDVGRSGVPSLTAEPSYYGSLSVLQLMYLITENNVKKNLPYMIMTILSVVMSGSLLSFVLLVIPAFRLPGYVKIASVFGLLLAFIIGLDTLSSSVLSTGFFNRVNTLLTSGIGPDILKNDISTNMRVGHAWFTMFANLRQEISYQSSTDFFYEYNAWSQSGDVFVAADTDSILASGGELIFRGGFFGAVLFVMIVVVAGRNSGTRYERVEKMAFVAACLANPISLANPFFVFYVLKAYRR